MSILARRWGFLLAFVPVLDFDDTLLFNHNKGGVYGVGGVNFINFVDWVLVRTCESPTCKFRLNCSRRRSFHLNSWINAAVERKVEELDLCIDRLLSIDCLSYERYDCYYEEEDEEYADNWAGNGNRCFEYRIVVDAPKLEDLKFKDYVAYGYSFKNVHSLVRAKIVLALRNPNRSYNRKKPNVTRSGLKILSGISNAKFLSLSGSSLKVFSLVNHDFPMFYNLTELKLRFDEHCGLRLPKLLQSSPNSEVLVIGKLSLLPTMHQITLYCLLFFFLPGILNATDQKCWLFMNFVEKISGKCTVQPKGTLKILFRSHHQACLSACQSTLRLFGFGD
ncbi:hypothetical protein DITRI_Ditri14bG0116900 [Diplodiscus trichospermus]